jgi:outer membrane receptor protein involved in Fe transport
MANMNHKLRRTAVSLALLMCCAAQAQNTGPTQTRELNIPRGDLSKALDAYAHQAGVQLIYKVDDVRSYSSNGLKGELPPQQALETLLKGTPLKVRRDGATAIIIYRTEAMAEEPAIPSAPPQAVTVTGSRIKSDDLVSDSPLQVVGSREIELQGASNVEDVLNTLPQLTAGQSASQSTYGTSGTATLNLRNLGPQRTLVLIDGRRMVPGDPILPYADVNFIPAALIDQVDIVTGGASAVYGSDAVAGVVNFKMKRNFDGVKVDYRGSISQHDNNNDAAQTALRGYNLAIPGSQLNGASNTLSIIAGKNTADGKGNLTFYATAAKTDPVSDATRDWAACGIGTNNGKAPNDTHLCQGSSNSAFGRFRTNGSGTGLANNPDGTASFVPYSSSTMGYNSNALTYLQRADERVSTGLFGSYKLTPAVELYSDVMFMNDRTRSQISPSGVTNNHTYTINCDNPLLTGAQASTLCGANAGSSSAVWKGTIGYRFADGGPRYDALQHRDTRLLVGARGEWDAHWGYDVYAQYSKVQYNDSYNNDVSVSRIQNALLVRSVNGVTSCVSGSNCVPLNIFQLGKASSAYPYLYETSDSNGEVTQKIASATVHGDLGQLGVQSPMAKAPVSIAAGAEWREDAISLNYSAALSAGDLAGLGARLPATGSTSVRELFTEVSAPLVEDRPGIKSLKLSAGYRVSDYDLAGVNHTYKLGLAWASNNDWVARAGYNRAVRAPNIVELFTPAVIGSAAGNDPCAGNSPSASLTACQRTGLTAAQYGKIADCSSGFCSALSGGNLGLKPETADTYTAGLVWTPTSMRNLSATVDYYNIKVKNIIGTVSTSLILSECLKGQDYYCGLIHRGANGSIASDDGYVVGTNQNTGYQHVAGVDVGVNYRTLPTASGRYSANFTGTWLQYQKNQAAPGQASYDCAGLYGPICGVPNPTWRHSLRVTWETPWKALLSVNWRYIGKTSLDSNSGKPVLTPTGAAYNIADARIPQYSYFDISGKVSLHDRVSLRFGINNVFDRDPPVLDNYNFPIITQVGNGNTYSGLYNTLGRVAYVGLGVEF